MRIEMIDYIATLVLSAAIVAAAACLCYFAVYAKRQLVRLVATFLQARKEAKRMAMFQSLLDEAQREGRARDERARAMRPAFGRPRVRG